MMMNPCNTQKFDIFLPIGRNCQPAFHLNESGLRFEAYPLDWQTGFSLDSVYQLFASQFIDFFQNIAEDESKGWEGKNRWIVDTKNQVISIHHFPRDVDIFVQQRQFRDKMKKRFMRLQNRLENSCNLALVSNRVDTIEQIQDFLQRFSKLYPHLAMMLINIRNDEEMDSSTFTMRHYQVGKNDLLDYRLNDTFNSETQEKFDWKGNTKI